MCRRSDCPTHGCLFHRRAASHAAKQGDPMTTVTVRCILPVILLITACTPGEALHRAAIAGQADEVKRLLKAGADAEARDQNGWTALHWAATLGKAAVATALLEHGANVTARAKDGTTALHWAAQEGKAAVVTVLLKRGGYVDARDKFGRTALYWAASTGKAAVVKLLLAHGADAKPYQGLLRRLDQTMQRRPFTGKATK